MAAWTRRYLLTGMITALALKSHPTFALPSIEGFKTPGCTCCDGWASHLRANGFAVAMRDAPDLAAVRKRFDIPDSVQGCHTALCGDLVVEGHVPAAALLRWFARPSGFRGIAVPGMPLGSPGMEVPGTEPETYTIYAFHADGRKDVFARARGSALIVL